MKIFDKNAALSLLDNDESLLEILVESFKNENKFERQELENLINEKKFKEAAEYVHATKGAARQLCIENLMASGQELEDVLRGKKSGDIKTLCEKMFSDYEDAMKEISR